MGYTTSKGNEMKSLADNVITGLIVLALLALCIISFRGLIDYRKTYFKLKKYSGNMIGRLHFNNRFLQSILRNHGIER